MILFDGVCSLCSAWSRFLLRHDRRAVFKLAPLQSPTGRAVLQSLRLPLDRFDTMIVIDAAGRPHTRSDAILHILRRLGFPYTLLAALGVTIPRLLRDYAYDLIAANRYRWFGQHDECMVPTPETGARFLT